MVFVVIVAVAAAVELHDPDRWLLVGLRKQPLTDVVAC